MLEKFIAVVMQGDPEITKTYLLNDSPFNPIFLIRSECALEHFHSKSDLDLLKEYEMLAKALASADVKIRNIVLENLKFPLFRQVYGLLIRIIAETLSADEIGIFFQNESNNSDVQVDIANVLILLNQEKKLLAIAEKTNLPPETLISALRKRKVDLLRVLLENPYLRNNINKIYLIHDDNTDLSKNIESLLSLAIGLGLPSAIALLREKGATLISSPGEKDQSRAKGRNPGVTIAVSEVAIPDPYAHETNRVEINVLNLIAQYYGEEIEIIEALHLEDSDVEYLTLQMVDRAKLISLQKFFEHFKNHFANINLRMVLLKSAIRLGAMNFIEYLLHDNPNLKPIDEKSQSEKQFDPVLASLLRIESLAVSSSEEKKYQLASRLISLGALTNADVIIEPTNKCMPLLHFFAQYGSPRLFRIFNSPETNFQAVCAQGRTALDYAFIRGSVSMVRAALSLGIKPSNTIYLRSNYYSFPKISKEDIELELIFLSLPFDLRELRFVFINEDNTVHDQYTASKHIEALLCNGHYHCVRSILRTYLEAGVVPNTHAMLNDLSESESPSVVKTLGYLHVVGLCVDSGLQFSEADLAMINDHSYYHNDFIKGVLQAFKIQSEEKIPEQFKKSIIDILQPLQIQGGQLIRYRLAILMQQLNKYDISFLYLQKALPFNSNLRDSLIDDNEYVELLYAWFSALKEKRPGVTPSENYFKLFDFINSLPCEQLTTLSHFKMADIFLSTDGLTFSQRYDSVKKHLPHVGRYQNHTRIQTFVSNMNNPENLFRYTLDRIIIKAEYSPAEKIAKLKAALEWEKLPIRLKNAGVEFVLKHERTEKENLSAAIQGSGKHSEEIVRLNSSPHP